MIIKISATPFKGSTKMVSAYNQPPIHYVHARIPERSTEPSLLADVISMPFKLAGVARKAIRTLVS